MSANYRTQDAVAIITINNPPINGLGLETRSAMVDGLNQALSDNAIESIIITGAGKAFSGGADIKEFNSMKGLAEPSLHTLLTLIENASKPVIAAIHTLCMGGGLELALCCHYRLVVSGAQIALPEVKLGLLPGAGGTQRLPRAVGLEMALQMIVSGTPVASEKLRHTGLFDRMIEGDLLLGAMAFSKEIAATRPLPKIRDINTAFPNRDELIEGARNAARQSAGHFPAPLKCIDAIAAAASLQFEEGMQLERNLFMELVQGTESKALRHAFFAERAAGKVPDIPVDVPTRPIQSVAVVGAGTMGCGIAMSFANAGIPVTILDRQAESLEKGLAAIRRNYESSVKKSKLTPEKSEQRLALIAGTLSYADVSQADLVIEAVFEDLHVKEAVFQQLDAVMKPGAILASNTSTLNIDRIADFTKRPQDVIGLHFFSPANVMKLLEIVRGEKTGKDVLASALALAKRIKKTGVVSGVCDGFIGNRMIEQYIRQAGFLVEEGCLPEQVDRAIEAFGFAMGPFRMNDLAGNDIGWAIRKRRYVERPDIAYGKTADLLCEMGRFGQKTGAGWYDYQTGDRKAHPSPTVNDMIVRHTTALGLQRRPIDDQEIVERLVYALINEGAHILDEGIAMRASDIDTVYLAGYGFPLFRGGPMFYADTIGLRHVVNAMEKYTEGTYGEAWKPAPLLLKLAQEGKTFN